MIAVKIKITFPVMWSAQSIERHYKVLFLHWTIKQFLLPQPNISDSDIAARELFNLNQCLMAYVLCVNKGSFFKCGGRGEQGRLAKNKFHLWNLEDCWSTERDITGRLKSKNTKAFSLGRIILEKAFLMVLPYVDVCQLCEFASWNVSLNLIEKYFSGKNHLPFSHHPHSLRSAWSELMLELYFINTLILLSLKTNKPIKTD